MVALSIQRYDDGSYDVLVNSPAELLAYCLAGEITVFDTEMRLQGLAADHVYK
jgi:hypothetical protein